MSELAADAMDRMYHHQRHIYDLTRKFYLLGRDRLIARLNPRAGMRVLEIGCGTGRNLIRTARRYPAAILHGIDVSNAMLDTAARAVARAGLVGRVSLAQADAETLTAAKLFGVDAFERVFISYALSMIPDWPAVLGHAIAALAPGGELHIVDFGTQARLPRLLRRLLRGWLALFDVTPRDRLAGELATLAARNDAFVLVDALYRGYAQYAIVRLPVAGTHGPNHAPHPPNIWVPSPASVPSDAGASDPVGAELRAGEGKNDWT